MNPDPSRKNIRSGEIPPEVSIVIVTYHSADVIGSCLDSIESAGSVSRVVFLVDNASTDGTAEVVRTRYPSVHLIANSDNRGFSAANNQAIPLCRGRFLFFLNPDAELAGGCLETAVRYWMKTRLSALRERKWSTRTARCRRRSPCATRARSMPQRSSRGFRAVSPACSGPA